MRRRGQSVCGWLLLVGLVTLAGRGLCPGAVWDLQSVDGRDYVTAANVAAFYRLPLAIDPAPATPDLPVPAPAPEDPSALRLTLNRREAFVFGVRQWLAYPVLPLPDGRVLVSRMDLVKSLDPLLRPPLAKGVLRGVKVVVLDPGHGGHDFGARSALGNEKTYSLDVCQRARPLLEAKGFQVLLTRQDDSFVPLPRRARVADPLAEAIFVSVHFNATGSNPEASGLEVFAFTPQGAPSTDAPEPTLAGMLASPGNASDVPSLLLASSVQTALLTRLPAPVVDRGIKRARFAVLRRTNVPAVLVEGGFLSNAAESARVDDAAWRERLARGLVSGIEVYRALAERHEVPRRLADLRREARLPASVRMVDADAPPAAASPAPPMPVANPEGVAAPQPPGISAPP